jgi:hypothetical protein
MSTEQGVGRFLTKSKSLLLLHDVDLSIIVTGRDKEKFKAIARTEPAVSKVLYR